MALGSAFSSGVQAGSSAVGTGLSLRRADEQREQDKNKQIFDAFTKSSEQAIKTAATVWKSASERQAAGEQIDMAQVNTIVDSLAASTLRSAQMLQQSGFPVDMNIVAQQFEAVKNQPSVTQQAVVEAGAAATKAGAVGEAEGDLKTFMKPDGEFASIRATDAEAIDTALNAGWVEMTASVQATSTEDLTKKTKGTLESDILGTDKTLEQLKVIRDKFDPSFTETGTKLFNAMAAASEKHFGINLSDATKEDLADFTTFGRRSISNINNYIKLITGAQMSEKEADRLRKAMPDIGDGIFSGDSATQFKSKLDDVISELEAANERAKFLRANGLVDKEISDEVAATHQLNDFRDLPARPEQFDIVEWNKMSPTDRRELITRLNASRTP